MRNRMFRVGATLGVVLATVLAGGWADDANAATRIVGGGNAPTGSWPSIVALVDNTAPSISVGTFCGGTLIDPEWVLTAAHCVTDEFGAVVPDTALDVVAGLTDLAVVGGAERRAVSIVRHPGYLPETFHNDVALLRLASPVTRVALQLVSPLRADLWDEASPAEIAGWGSTLPASPTDPFPVTSLPNALQQAQISVQSDATCSALYGADFSNASMLCAGPLAGGVDSCYGDSGGPLTVRDGATRTLAGAVSWGFGCAAPSNPGVYTRLHAMRSFIFGVTGLDRAVPGAPTAPAAVAGSGSATVSWIAPVNSGGRALQTYAVRFRANGGPASAPILVSAPATQTTVTGLAGGVTYTFTVEVANDVGVGSPSTATAGVVPAVLLPINTALPTIVGVARVGTAIQATPGTWSNTTAPFAFSWQACDLAEAVCAAIPGATGASFVPTPSQVGKRLRVDVTASNIDGSIHAVSAATAAVLPPGPALSAQPVLTGIAQQGQTLTVTPGTWDAFSTTVVQWQRCDVFLAECTDIPAATTSTLVVDAALVGWRILVAVTATNAGGSVTVFTSPSAMVTGPAPQPQPQPQTQPPPSPAPLTLAALGVPRVTQAKDGLLTVVVRVRVEAGATLSVAVRNAKGQRVTVSAAKSRIDGVRARRIDGRRLSAVAGSSGVVTLKVVFSGHLTAPKRLGRLALSATARGQKVALTPGFRARF